MVIRTSCCGVSERLAEQCDAGRGMAERLHRVEAEITEADNLRPRRGRIAAAKPARMTS